MRWDTKYWSNSRLECQRVIGENSEWFWAEPNSTYYLKSKYLKNYDVSKKYYVFSKIKDENNNYILKCEEITSTYFDYIVVENNNFGLFTICEYNN